MEGSSAFVGANPERSDSSGISEIVKTKRPQFPRVAHDHYVEDLACSRELFAELRGGFGPDVAFSTIVDPCAGFGNIVASAREAGFAAYGSDLIRRAPGMAGGRDFLSDAWRAPRRAGAEFAIVGNPPFQLLRGFCEAACARAPVVIFLAPQQRLRCAFRWLTGLPLKWEVHPSRRPSMWPGAQYAAKIAAGEPLRTGRDEAVWLIFERGWTGPVMKHAFRGET